MIRRKIQREEVVPLILDLRSRRHGEPEPVENVHDVLDHAPGGMDPPDPAMPPGHGEIESTVDRRRSTDRLTPSFEGGLEALLEIIDCSAKSPPLLDRERREALHDGGECPALPAEDRNGLGFERGAIESGNGREPRLQLGERRELRGHSRAGHGPAYDCALASSAILANASASWTARSASILRSTSTPALARPAIRRLYEMPFWRAAALMRVIQRLRKSLFFLRRSR